MELQDTGVCFVCGDKNERGLKLEFQFDPRKKRLSTQFKVAEWQQGFARIMHGGFLALLLDEVMVKLGEELGETTVTAEMTVRLRKAVPVGTILRISAEIERETKRLLYARADAQTLTGEEVASARGKLVRTKEVALCGSSL